MSCYKPHNSSNNLFFDLKEIHTTLSHYTAQAQPIPHTTAEPILDKLSSLNSGLEALGQTLQSATDVNDALALVVLMMDSAYDRKLDAEQVRCLLAPLQEKLGKAVEGMRLAF